MIVPVAIKIFALQQNLVPPVARKNPAEHPKASVE
jgi:hypothetical protein